MLLSLNIEAQSINELKREINEAEFIITTTTNLLETNKSVQKSRQEQLLLVNQNIQTRKRLINSLDSKSKLLQKSISTNAKEIEELKKSIKSLKEQYSNIAVSSYLKIEDQNYLKFLLGAEDFNDIPRRLHYIKVHFAISKLTITTLNQKSDELAKKSTEYNEKCNELSKDINSKASEVKSLNSEQNSFSSQLKKLESEEKNLTKTLKEKQQDIAKMQEAIQRIIEEEASKKEGYTPVQKEDLLKLSNIFEENKGKFPKPVPNGAIIERFGIHAHPLQKGITINNKGINILVDKSSNIHSIYDGVVTKVFFFTGLGNSVMIRHGNYISVYSNLTNVEVKTGQKVTTNQRIGQIIPSSTKESMIIHFELWNETTPLNPELWIKK